MRKRQKTQINYLKLIPRTSAELRWHRDSGNRVVLVVENKGLFHTIARKVFHKPRFTNVHLDEHGSFIWPLIDGRKTVADIAAQVQEGLGKKAEPLYPRIVKYFQILESYHFVELLHLPVK